MIGLGADMEMEVVKHDPGPPEADLGLFRVLGSILEDADRGSSAIRGEPSSTCRVCCVK